MQAAERDHAWRTLFAQDLLEVDPHDLIYLDESGFHTSMTRTYARSPRGARAYGTVPRNRGTNLTLLCAVTLQGPCAPWLVDGGVNGDVFLTYVNRILVPELRAGQVVVMDNLGAHRCSAVRTSIEATGAQLVFLPPYSPDLSPIELMFSSNCSAGRAQGLKLGMSTSPVNTLTKPSQTLRPCFCNVDM
ncbi:IS630 family transposase [Deinococcus sp. PEB2-63]